MQTASPFLASEHHIGATTPPHLHSSITHLQASELSQLTPRWKRLTNSARYAEPFYQPEWFNAFATAFAPDGEIILATAHHNSELVGIAPFLDTNRFFGRIPAHTYRSLSGIHSCRYDIMHSSDGTSVSNALWKALRNDSSWQVIEALDVPADATWYTLMKLAQRDGFLVGIWPTRRSPYLSLPAPGDDPFKNCPASTKSYRSQLERKLRQLRREGTVSFTTETKNAHAALSEFIALELSGWKGANGSAIGSRNATRQFYDVVTDELAQQGNLRISALQVDSTVIAMQLGFVMNGIYYVPKIAYSELFGKFSPGQLLWHHVIAELPSLGVHAIDFLGPQARWKSVWTSQVRIHNTCYIFRPTLHGRLLYTLTMKLGRLARYVRHAWYGDPQALQTPPNTTQPKSTTQQKRNRTNEA
jgi:CelD/BcsL family acetyltransferase involved in cellulose biosynthesis